MHPFLCSCLHMTMHHLPMCSMRYTFTLSLLIVIGMLKADEVFIHAVQYGSREQADDLFAPDLLG